jgi:hypothetical protein
MYDIRLHMILFTDCHRMGLFYQNPAPGKYLLDYININPVTVGEVLKDFPISDVYISARISTSLAKFHASNVTAHYHLPLPQEMFVGNPAFD